jgi:hypothetical protein
MLSHVGAREFDLETVPPGRRRPVTSRVEELAVNPRTDLDAALDRLHRAGWTVGEVCCGSAWIVCGQNGENLIRAEGTTQAEAWRRACEQAAMVGMLAPERTEKWTR